VPKSNTGCSVRWDKNCPIQCLKRWVPDRPDILVMKKFKTVKKRIPVLHCEVKPSASEPAAAWDLLRLARFGRASLAWGHSMACLIQVVHKTGTYMRIKEEGGLFVLRRVGTFELALGLDDLPKLVESSGVLLKARVSFSVFWLEALSMILQMLTLSLLDIIERCLPSNQGWPYSLQSRSSRYRNLVG